MPKTSREQITNDEKKIIRELQKNSKENIDRRSGESSNDLKRTRQSGDTVQLQIIKKLI